ncbi:hypothetical protein [Natronorubrum sp. FCH18a]|uniref:hypothetical protein n=1 Tax=Natronorubrum sp. FCH18a TaxID=3447018 RepID=UPI003F513DAE
MSQSHDSEKSGTEYTNVPVKPDVRDELYNRKRGPGDTYDAVVRRLLEADK